MKSLICQMVVFSILCISFANKVYGRPNDRDSVLFSDFIGNMESIVAHEGESDTFRIDTYTWSLRAGTDRVGSFDSLVIDSIQMISYTPGSLPLVTFKFKSTAPYGPFGPKTTDTICSITNSSIITNSSGKFMVDNDVAGGDGYITDFTIESQSSNTVINDSIYASIRFVARRLFVMHSQVSPILLYDTLFVKGIQNSKTNIIQFRKNSATTTINKHSNKDFSRAFDLSGRVTTTYKLNRSNIFISKNNNYVSLQKH